MTKRLLIIWGLAFVVAALASPVRAASEDYQLTLKNNGTVIIDNGEQFQVASGVDLDSLTWVALDNSGRMLDNFTAILNLPKPITDESQFSYQLIGINGVTNPESVLVTPTKIRYSATAVGSSATLSVIANFPKGYLDLPVSARAEVAILELNKVWVVSSIAIPAVGILVLLYMGLMRWLDRRIPKVSETPTKPPLALSPALLSILYENKIEPEAIAATLLDLAKRDYISIFKKGKHFIFAKEKEIDLSTPAFQVGSHDVVLSDEEQVIAEREGLRPFEKILLSKLFVSARPISSREDVKVRIGHGLFSKKVAAIYEYLFRDASKFGYFVPDSINVHRRYLVIGWILGIVAFGVFIYSAFTLPDPKYFLLFWAGLILLSFLITRLARYVPLRTPSGRTELSRFLAFRSYLVSKESLPENVGIDTFFEYLPLAWSLRAHATWAKRFHNQPFHRPYWYYTSSKLKSAEEFITDIEPLINFVADSFAAVRERTLA